LNCLFGFLNFFCSVDDKQKNRMQKQNKRYVLEKIVPLA